MADEAEGQKRGRGRPRRHSAGSKRYLVSFRASEGLHGFLVKAAEQGGLSISETVERHLENVRQKIGRVSLDDLLIGTSPLDREFLRLLIVAFSTYASHADLREDQVAAAGLRGALDEIRNIFAPLPEDVGLTANEDLRASYKTGRSLGNHLARTVAQAELAMLQERDGASDRAG